MPRKALLVLTGLLLLGAGLGCQREAREQVIGTGYIAPNAVNLRDRLGAQQITIATLKNGQRVDILQKKRGWVRVRTTTSAVGWIEERHLLSPAVLSKFEKLRLDAGKRPSQGTAHPRGDLNLHADPDRKSPVFYQLKEEDVCEVVGRAVAERPPRAGQTEKAYQDWFLLRAKDKAGWGLAGAVDMSVPEEVLQYAEGKRIVAWFILEPGPREGEENKPSILWATTSGQGLDYDFDSVRLFRWGHRKKRYETSFIEHNLRGYYPIEIWKQEEVPGFSVTSENKQGQKTVRKFLMKETYVKRLPVL